MIAKKEEVRTDKVELEQVLELIDLAIDLVESFDNRLKDKKAIKILLTALKIGKKKLSFLLGTIPTGQIAVESSNENEEILIDVR